MKSVYSTALNRKVTPQSEPIPGSNQVVNSAGGYAYQIDCWQQFERFLILGSSESTYYVTAKDLTKDNISSIQECLKKNSKRTIDMIVDVSDKGRAVKNDPALFALAVAASDSDLETRTYALDNLNKVARIGTHFLHFVDYINGMRGWGNSLKKHIGNWFNDKSAEDLAFQVLKYANRDGWTMRDVLRLSHPSPISEAHNSIFNYVVTKDITLVGIDAVREVYRKNASRTDQYVLGDQLPNLFVAYEAVQKAWAKNAPDRVLFTVKAIELYNLQREMLPTEALKEPAIWSVLLQRMGPEAMVRNLGVMTANGTLKMLSNDVKLVVQKLSNTDLLKKARLHPIKVLLGLKNYTAGHGFKGSLSWIPVAQITDALNDAFYKCFDFVEPTGKNHFIGIDVSSSMTWAGSVTGSNMTAAEVAAAMAMVTVRTEPNTAAFGFSTKLVDIGISKNDRLDTVLKKTRAISMGGTDCAAPMEFARANKLDVEIFQVITDNESWHNPRIHPSQSLKAFRNESGIRAKLAVLATTATKFSIADPNDPLSLDIVGFDTTVPTVLNYFAKL